MNSFIFVDTVGLWIRLDAITCVSQDRDTFDLVVLAGSAQFKIPLHSPAYLELKNHLAAETAKPETFSPPGPKSRALPLRVLPPVPGGGK